MSLRKSLLLLAFPTVAVLVVTTVTLAEFLLTPPPTATTPGGPCLPTVLTSAGNSGQKTVSLNAAQLGIASRIIALGSQRGLAPRAWQVAIQAGMTESHLTNLPGGDRDSRGIFQMRPSAGWGTPEQVTNVDYEINTFYTHLQAVHGWQQMPPGDAAQAVERSAFPQRYQEWEVLATTLVARLGGVSDATGCASVNSSGDLAQRVIAFAMAQLGKPYQWGGTGPEVWDCSGLTQAAYQSVGIAVPRAAFQQYNAGSHVPYSQAAPGDLVFWADAAGNPAAIQHVAIYLGGGRVIQAPDVGQVVSISPVPSTGLVSMVTRPAALSS